MDKELTRGSILDQESGETIFQKGKTGRGAGAQIEVTDSSLEKDVAEAGCAKFRHPCRRFLNSGGEAFYKSLQRILRSILSSTP